MLRPSKKSLLPPNFTPGILTKFLQLVPPSQELRSFPAEACFLERPSCPEWCFLGQSESPFRVFPCLLNEQFLENNDLFVIGD